MAGKKNGAAKWLAAMTGGAARQNYVDGINSTTVNPMQLAADQEQLYLAMVTESVNSGRRRAALMAVPMQTWKDNATGKGSVRLADGAKTAAPKMVAHFQKWQPVYDQASAAAAAIPKDGTTDTALRKVAAAIGVLKAAAGRS